MLKFFRQKHIAKIIFWGLVILVLPAFVLWGTGSLSGSKGDDKGPAFVGLIDNRKVSFEELFESMAAIRAQIILNYFSQPEIMDSFLKNRPFLAKLAWDRLIMVKEAKRRNLKVPDNEVIAAIRAHLIFTRSGAFDDRLYGYILRNNIGLDARNFEEVMRENLAIKRLSDIVTKDVTVSEEEIRDQYKSDNEKFKLSYLLIDSKTFLDKVGIGDEAVKEYYERHKAEFALPVKEAAEKEARFSNFDDVKSSIRSYLAEHEARSLAVKEGVQKHKELTDAMKNENASFEAACANLRAPMKTSESVLFSRADYLEGIGEARGLVDAASNMKEPGQFSDPIEVRGGVIIFKVLETKGIDEEKFKAEKDQYSKKALEAKKMKAVDVWFMGLLSRTNLKLDLGDIERYYK